MKQSTNKKQPSSKNNNEFCIKTKISEYVVPCSIWYGAIVRGDVNPVSVGAQSSIGDRAVVHVAKIQSDFPTIIGDYVTIHAGAIVHAATIQHSVIIGEMAQLLDGSVIESNTIIAPGSIVPPGTRIPSGEYWSGAPAKKVRSLSPDEIINIKNVASDTVLLAAAHAIENAKSYEQILEEEELADINENIDESAPRQPEYDISDVLGQGHPGRIFRSTLTHPEEAAKAANK
jgi:gamma-carbonic anhydrase